MALMRHLRSLTARRRVTSWCPSGRTRLNTSTLKACTQAVCLLVSAEQVYAVEPTPRDVRAELIPIQEVLKVARHEPGKTAASLELICSESSTLHLVLTTRLPGPRWAIAKEGRDNASLFIGSRKQELNVVMNLVKKGRDLSWLEAAVLEEGEGEQDTLVTPPLAADAAVAIGSAFGDSPPSKVAVIGYAETGVFMTGVVAGQAISEFSSSCLTR